MITVAKAIDYRKLDLKKREHKQYADDTIGNWITYSEQKFQEEDMQNRWQLCQMYYEGYQVPVGTTENVLEEFVKKNSNKLDLKGFKMKKDKDDIIYFVDNKISKVVDGNIGEFASAEKNVIVENDDFGGNDGIEYSVQNWFRDWEQKKQIWKQVRVPAIKDMIIYGLSFIEVSYNPRVNIPFGDIREENYHPKDVLFSVYTTKKFLLDTNYIAVRKRVPYNEAVKLLGRYGIKEQDVKPDDEYSTYSDKDQKVYGDEIFCTIYFGEHRKVYTNQISLAETMDVPLEQVTEEDNIEVEEIYYFDFIYTKTNGVVYHAESKYYDRSDLDSWQFRKVPIFNKESGIRLYPISDVEKLINLQDTINILKSLIFNDARDKKKVRLAVKKSLKERYSELFNDFLRFGGILPVDEDEDVSKSIKEVKTPDLPKEIYEFLSITEQSMKDATIMNESLAGDYPEKGNVSGVAIARLQGLKRQMGSYKSDNIVWAMSQLAQKVYRILAEEYTEEHFVKVNKKQKDDIGYIPMCATWTLQDYEDFLKIIFPEVQDLQEASKKFQSKNDVLIEYITDNNGIPLSEQEIKQDKSLVFINHLKDHNNKIYPLKVKVQFSFDAERNELEDRIIASELFNAQQLTLEMYLDKLGGWFKLHKDEIVESVSSLRQGQQLLSEIEKRGEPFMQQLMKLMQLYDNQINQPNEKSNNRTDTPPDGSSIG